jgi:hypothetical protein
VHFWVRVPVCICRLLDGWWMRRHQKSTNKTRFLKRRRESSLSVRQSRIDVWSCESNPEHQDLSTLASLIQQLFHWVASHWISTDHSIDILLCVYYTRLQVLMKEQNFTSLMRWASLKLPFRSADLQSSISPQFTNIYIFAPSLLDHCPTKVWLDALQ